MNRERPSMNRVYHRLTTASGPAAQPARRAAPRVLGFAATLARSAGFLALAWARGCPGLGMRARIGRLGWHVLRTRTPLPAAYGWTLLLTPMDSVRYFEFEFAWASARAAPTLRRYLDVSSPRLFPVVLMASRPGATAELLNPDERDLAETRQLVAACGLSSRCRLASAPIDAAELSSDHYDLVTSLSVVEHIPAPGDGAAVEQLWRAVRPGGRLVVTVPCAREAFDEYLDVDEYGLLPHDENGFVFAQRFYDQRLVEETFFARCGAPHRAAVFGENRAGTFFEDRLRKHAGLARPDREPYGVATGYSRFESIGDLPGIGVVALEFLKPAR